MSPHRKTASLPTPTRARLLPPVGLGVIIIQNQVRIFNVARITGHRCHYKVHENEVDI